MLHVDCWSDCKSCCIKLTHFIIYILSIIQHSTTTAKTITYASHIARLVILWVKSRFHRGLLGCPGGDWGSPGPVSGLGFQHAAEPPGGFILCGELVEKQAWFCEETRIKHGRPWRFFWDQVAHVCHDSDWHGDLILIGITWWWNPGLKITPMKTKTTSIIPKDRNSNIGLLHNQWNSLNHQQIGE